MKMKMKVCDDGGYLVMKGAGLFQRAGQTMKQAGAKGTSRYLIGIKS